MIKILGAILLVGAASVIGFGMKSRLELRVRSVRTMLNMLGIMRAEIGQALTPLPELLEKLAKIAPAPADAFFESCAEEMKIKPDVPFGIIWRRSLSRADYLGLCDEEREELSELGNVLGRYRSDEQVLAISHAMRALERISEAAESDRARLGKVYARLSIVCAAAVVIIFI